MFENWPKNASSFRVLVHVCTAFVSIYFFLIIIYSTWECRQWAPMVDVIMNWMPLLSKWILDNILQDMILKRIQKQVDEWNPMTDPVPIHSWIYPWINLLGKMSFRERRYYFDLLSGMRFELREVHFFIIDLKYMVVFIP